jgi:hypothetical protein
MQIEAQQDVFTLLINQAVRDLVGQGWNVLQQQTEEVAPWHLIVHKGERWRIVQLVAPATAPTLLQSRRLALGDAVRMPSRVGTMEQWLAHVRPDGHISFGPYVLNGQRWAGSDEDWRANGGIEAVLAASEYPSVAIAAA